MSTPSDSRKTGTRRSAQSRASILAATQSELAEAGWRKFSVDRVAKSAHASKQTIYKWWPAIGTMCVEAGLSLIGEPRTRGQTAAERISDLVKPLETAIRAGSGHAILRGAMLAACDDDDAGQMWRAWQKEAVRSPLRLVLAETANRGAIRRDFDIDQAVNALLGPIWHRVLLMRAPIEDGFSETAANSLLIQLKA